MNKAKIILVFLLTVSFLMACEKNKEKSADAIDSDTSYAFGMLMASHLSGMGFMELDIDYKAFMEGFKAFNEAAETRITPDDAMNKINAVFNRIQAQGEETMWLDGEKNRGEGEAFMAENGARSEVTTLPSGLQYEVIAQGSGKKPGPDDTVRVHYEGTFIDGKVFDSSYARGEPAEFPLGAVISGWSEGVQLMSPGSTYRFVIPPNLAYGPGGSSSIPPSSTLVFKVELISVVE